jgi:hypothetical protein
LKKTKTPFFFHVLYHTCVHGVRGACVWLTLIAAMGCASPKCRACLSYSLLADVQEERGIVCVCVCGGGRCRAATVRVKSGALCCLSNPGAWDVVDLDFAVARPQSVWSLRPVRLGSESICHPISQPRIQECDTIRSATCVVPVTRMQSPLPTRRR